MDIISSISFPTETTSTFQICRSVMWTTLLLGEAIYRERTSGPPPKLKRSVTWLADVSALALSVDISILSYSLF